LALRSDVSWQPGLHHDCIGADQSRRFGNETGSVPGGDCLHKTRTEEVGVMKRTWKAMALVSVASFLLAACAGDGGSSEATPSPSVDEADALLDFAECMREQGIDEYPDPVVDENGAVTIPNVRMSATREELADAEEACKDLLPEDQGPGEVPPGSQTRC